MPWKPARPCVQPGCPESVRGKESTCPEHAKQRHKQRANRGGSSYGRNWRERVQPRFIYRNPWCVLCGGQATVADHWPISRRDLVAKGEASPDSFKHLRPLCKACDAKERPKREPGGFYAERRFQQEASQRAYRRWTADPGDVPPF
jgi:5-methylcytosine-specific restriction protein A